MTTSSMHDSRGDLHSSSLSVPRLEPNSQLAFRIGLARRRTESYPLDSMDFIMTDLERPDMHSHHSFWCTGDLSGRILEFLSSAAMVEGVVDHRLTPLFERILRQQRASGLIGRYAPEYLPRAPEENCQSGSGRLLSGLMRYFELTGDQRALNAAIGMGEFTLKKKDEIIRSVSRFGLDTWMTEHLALLYSATGDSRYLQFCSDIGEAPKIDQRTIPTHSHGFMSTLRGLQLAALITDDPKWNRIPEYWRRIIIDEHWELPDGNVGEHFPRSFRNEGCSIADWLMLNLNAGLLGSDDAYGKAENILWNALYFNQMINGAFGHRELTQNGIGYLNEPDAWWCCTMHGGMAMTEAARHAVTLKGDVIRVNLLLPGDFTVTTDRGEKVTVKIRTAYPARAESTITVCLPRPEMSLKLRIPMCIRDPQIIETHAGNRTTVDLKGGMGHWLEHLDDKMLLVRFGPLVLTSNIYFWRDAGRDFSSILKVDQSPTNYLPPMMPAGIPQLIAANPNGGNPATPRGTAPSFSLFEEGPAARCFIPGAPADLNLRFDNGEVRTIYARPMCATLSSFVAHDAPFIFRE